MKRYVSLFFFFLVSCFSQGNTPFYFYNDENGDSPEFHFEYGNLETSSALPNTTEFLHHTNGVLCVFSIPLKFYKLELGAKFRICWKVDEGSFDRWKTGFQIWNQGGNEYVQFSEQGKGWKISLTTYSKWKEERESFQPQLEWKKQVWSTGLVSYQSFAIPHPIFLKKSNEDCEAVFRSYHLQVSDNQMPTLVFSFPCPDVDVILDSILRQNQTWFSQCENVSPIISEVFRHSDSVYERFMEWQNPKDTVICPLSDSIDWEKDGQIQTFQSEEFRMRSRLLLPNGILLFSDNPKFQGITIPKLFLSQLGTSQSFRWGETFVTDDAFSFKQGEEFFTKQWLSNSCRDSESIWISQQTFCGSPGLPNTMDRSVRKEVIPSCETNQIQITEFYPGNFSDAKIPLPAFFEFQNQGKECDLSNLNWILDGKTFPLSAKEMVLSEHEVFLITKEKWQGWDFLETEKPFSLSRLLFQIPNFQWQNRKTGELRTFTSDPNRFFLLRKGGQNVNSISQKEGMFLPHPRQGSNETLRQFGFWMSPGTYDPQVPLFLGSELLELAERPYPFFDFGFREEEEGVGQFQTANAKEYLFWKPMSAKWLSFISEPSVCHSSESYQLPNDFFLPTIRSLRYKEKETSSMVEKTWTEKDINQYSFGDTRSLLFEDPPFFFSSSLSQSIPCPGLWRSPGGNKIRSLEIRKGETIGLYHTNLPWEEDLGVKWGNESWKWNLTPVSLSDKSFELDLTSIFPFGTQEQLYSYFDHPKLVSSMGFLEKPGAVRIEAIYPNPFQSQNEWIYVCNHSARTEDLSLYLIEDETSTDELISYQTRFPSSIPIGKNGHGFVSSESLLPPSTCAWIVDPDGKDWYLPVFHSETDRLLTVSTTQTIGNGISSGEWIQLRKKVDGKSLLISSFGHKESAKSFRKYTNSGEYLWLKANQAGTSSDDFEIYREEN